VGSLLVVEVFGASARQMGAVGVDLTQEANHVTRRCIASSRGSIVVDPASLNFLCSDPRWITGRAGLAGLVAGP
jgi:hypothetical protein